jgi:hypothetical protein
LADIDIAPPAGDSGALERLATIGMDDRSGALARPVADLSRKINPDANVADAFGSASARSRQSSSHAHTAAKVPGAITPDEGQPVRKP